MLGNNAHKIAFVIVALLLIAGLMGWQQWEKHKGVSKAFLSDKEDNPSTMRLGDSGKHATNSNLRGPHYLTSAVPLHYPPPLAHLNPITSNEMIGG